MTARMTLHVRWEGVDTMQQRVVDYGEAVKLAVRRIAEYWAAVFEAYAKENAPWTDRTGNARQGLYATVVELAEDTVAVYLSHTMDYGKWLELSVAGKWAIIWPTIEQHIPAVEKMLKEVFS